MKLAFNNILYTFGRECVVYFINRFNLEGFLCHAKEWIQVKHLLFRLKQMDWEQSSVIKYVVFFNAIYLVFQ